MELLELERFLYRYAIVNMIVDINKRDKYRASMMKPNSSGEMMWVKDYFITEEMFNDFLFIEKELSIYSMSLYYNKRKSLYEAEIYRMIRNGGYKEPFEKEILHQEQDIRLRGCLQKLNETLSLKQNENEELTLKKVTHE